MYEGKFLSQDIMDDYIDSTVPVKSSEIKSHEGLWREYPSQKIEQGLERIKGFVNLLRNMCQKCRSEMPKDVNLHPHMNSKTFR